MIETTEGLFVKVIRIGISPFLFFLKRSFPLEKSLTAGMPCLEINTFALGSLNDEFSYLRLSPVYIISSVLGL